MGYCRSSAFVGLQHRLISLRRLTRLASSAQPPLRPEIEAAVYQAAVFQSHAACEDYIGELIADWIHRLKANGMTNSAMPSRLRTFILATTLLPKFEQYVANRNMRALLEATDVGRAEYLIIDDAKSIASNLGGPTIIGNDQYPSIKKLRKLFHRLAIPGDIIQMASKRTRSPFELRMQDFADARTALAHSSPPQITSQDVERHLSTALDLSTSIDRIMYKHVLGLSGTNSWPR